MQINNRKRKFTIANPQGIILWVVNIAVLAAEIRVYMTIEALTGSVASALLALFGTGVWFVLWWDVLQTHQLAGVWQKRIDIIMTLWSLFMSTIFVFADFAVKTSVNGKLISTDSLIALLAFSTVFNILAALAWYKMDEETQMKTKMAKSVDKSRFDKQTYEQHAVRMQAAKEALDMYDKLVKQYGIEAVKAMGVEPPTLGKVSQNQRPAPPTPPAPSPRPGNPGNSALPRRALPVSPNQTGQAMAHTIRAGTDPKAGTPG